MTKSDRPCALVTGAGRGLGRAIAETFHAKGYFVVATDYDDELLVDLEGRSGFWTARQDVRDIDAAAEVARQIRERCGRLDVVVNNAGVNRFYPVSEAPAQQTIDAFMINTLGAVVVTQACFDLLVESKGRVVNIASESSTFRPPFQVYQATKMALEAVSDVLRREFQLLGVHVAIIRPGAIDTDLIKGARHVEVDLPGSRYEPYFPILREMVARGMPKSVSTPTEVANVVHLAATDPRKRAMYRVNNDPKQRLAARIPLRWMDRILLRMFRPPAD